MNVSDAIKKRRSIREFNLKKAITDKQIEKLLNAARLAPSAGNLQSFFFLVVKDQNIKDQLANAANSQDFIAQAPVVFVACADLKQVSYYGGRGTTLYCIQDATIATQNIWLQAVEMGLAACWVGALNENQVSQILDIPNHLRPVAILPVGYPAESSSPPTRRSIEEISKKI